MSDKTTEAPISRRASACFLPNNPDAPVISAVFPNRLKVFGIFKDLFQQERNPLSSKIYWECDDVNNGKIDWLAITEMDTLQPKTSWHNEVNFNIDKWLSYNEK